MLQCRAENGTAVPSPARVPFPAAAARQRLSQSSQLRKEVNHMFAKAVQILGPNPRDEFALPVLNNLGNVYFDIGPYAKADSVVRRALVMAESGSGEPSHLAYILSSVGRVYVVRKQYVAAEEAFRKAVSIFAGTLGARRPEYALALTNLALVYQRQRRLQEALPLFESALDILERSFGRDATVLATTPLRLCRRHESRWPEITSPADQTESEIDSKTWRRHRRY